MTYGKPPYVSAETAEDFLQSLQPETVDLILIDPPYYGIVDDSWDNQWSSVEDYVAWLSSTCLRALPLLKSNGSLIFFGGIGKHGCHPFWSVCERLERGDNMGHYTFRNMITWKKRRAYGKSHDYLFCREEIAWYSKSPDRTSVTFNIPLTSEKRGYAGWNKKYAAKSEFKRVSNVWDDVPELMRPERNCQKPLPLMRRLVETHSNPNDLIVDMFVGYGTTGIAALGLGRKFVGCEAIAADAIAADDRCIKAAQEWEALDGDH
jgi:DNA modification methylase